MSNDNNNTMPVPWGRLKAWIEAQEQAEQQGYNPKPMTKPQVAALSYIVDFTDGPEPDVSDRDYTRKVPLQYQDLEPIEVPIDGVFMLRWRTVCILASAKHKEFPCLGHGLYEGKQPPLFKSKKMSKQYAAKHAWQYLKSHPQPMSSSAPVSIQSNGGAPLRPTLSPSARNLAAVSSTSATLQLPTGGVPVTPPSLSPSPSASDVAKSDTVAAENTDFYDNPKLPSLLEQVATETVRLGIGCPKYEIEPDPEQPGCFAGRPVFQNGGRIPQDMGHVKGALSKSLAKELIAEAVLRFCELELKRRHGLIQTWGSSKNTPTEE
ncbi:hypothetical protein ACHAQJ_007257 [Trichoderma viride]